MSSDKQGEFMSKLEVLNSIREILATHCKDPSDELITHGKALIGIGEALKGQSFRDAKAIIEAVAAIEIGSTKSP